MTNGRGVAQWVVPKRQPTSNNSRSTLGKENRKNDDGSSSSNSNRLAGTSDTFRRNPSNDQDNQPNTSSIMNENPTYLQTRTYYDAHSQQYHSTTIRHPNTGQANQATKIDDAICKTICVIVEEYLKELREHQQQINQARAKLIRDGHRDPRGDGGSGYFIAHTDMSRLHVRDEQTKAIGTIKQLTNYLKELSTIKRQENSDSGEVVDTVSEDIHNKLSDLRHEIINTLNDFVLANGDIDVPIVDLEDPTGGRDYDLCVEAQRSTRDIRELEITQSLSITPQVQQQSLRKRPLANRNNDIIDADDKQRDAAIIEQQQLDNDDGGDKYKLMTGHNDYQLIEVDKRRREINKLEKDTVELRNLFANFYTLVKTQGEQVDTIEDNLVMAAQHISEGRSHLSQTRSMRGLTVLLPMTGCITGALIGGPIGFLVGGKLGSITIICASSLLGLLSSLGAQKCIETGGKIK